MKTKETKRPARFVRMGVATALMLMVAQGVPGASLASGAASAPLTLACPQAPAGLCEALQSDLSRAAGTQVRVLSSPATAPARGEGLHVELHLTRADRVALEGRLSWQRAGAKAPTQGPVVFFSVDDVALSPGMYPQFTGGLVKASPLPL